MRTPGENKGTTLLADRCPRCGRKGTACRSVPKGHWCQRDGLEEDRSLWVHPEPDSVTVAVDNDPDVVAAREEEGLAVAEFEKADEAWKAALCKLATARITGRTQIAYSAIGEQIITPPKRSDRKREARLIEEEVGARGERDRAGKAAAKARHRQRAASEAARIAAAVREQGW